MPWFPDFTSAVELARRQTQEAGPAVAAGDAEAVVATFAPDGYFRGPFGPRHPSGPRIRIHGVGQPSDSP